jgi:DNA-binding GntR family transcriptional regulator
MVDRMAVEPISRGSVVDLAYRQIRGLIEEGQFAPNARLRQGDLADALAISRSSVREALHRLTADELVVFETNRGFSVAAIHLQGVLERLEVRRVLEPGIARLASERRTDEDLEALAQIIERQVQAEDARAAHDMSRAFHVRLAEAARNEQFVRVFESLWSLDIGRRLLARRMSKPGWQEADAEEHKAILAAVASGDAGLASVLMERHLGATQEHWTKEADVPPGDDDAGEESRSQDGHES